MQQKTLVPFLVCATGYLLGWGVCASLSPLADSPASPLLAAAPDLDPPSSSAPSSEIGPPANGDWPQWGGSSVRNNTPRGTNIPTDWDVGSFDRGTGNWNQDGSENVKWIAAVGSQTYGNPVVADRRVFVGTNNGAGYLAAIRPPLTWDACWRFPPSTARFCGRIQVKSCRPAACMIGRCRAFVASTD